MADSKGRSRQFADWEEKIVKDYDPEAEALPANEDANGSEESADENAAATEHYEKVGRSKLRRKQAVALGPKYRGAPVSRSALEQESSDDSADFEDAREDQEDGSEEEFDDPETADLEKDQFEDDEDAEIESDNALGESDEEKFQNYVFRGSAKPRSAAEIARKQRPSAADFMDEEAEESEDENEDIDARDVEDISEEEEEDEDDDDSEGSLGDFIDDGDSEDEQASLNDGEDEEGDDQEDGKSGEEDDDDEGEGENDSNDEEAAAEPKDQRQRSLKDLLSGKSKLDGSNASRNAADSLVDAMQKDVKKGKAVRQQRQAFDSVLNVRMRLQKALVAVNSFSAIDHVEGQIEAYEAAEAAAVKLWNAIGEYRAGMYGQFGHKRKREIEVTTSTQEVWDNMQGMERHAVAYRKHVLDHWSGTVKRVRVDETSSKSKLNGASSIKVDKPITMVLEQQLEDPERLIKRTHTPRSCAPAQVAQNVDEDPEIYDDADFYQLLLKELVDQRTADTSSVGGQAAIIRYAAVKEAKTKKHVDTKASKGRKMRFGVHEKLQNFMAPEDRRSWEQDAIDRFFGTLFGQKMQLDEDDADDEEMDGVTAEEAGLRLFRN